MALEHPPSNFALLLPSAFPLFLPLPLPFFLPSPSSRRTRRWEFERKSLPSFVVVVVAPV